MGVFYVWLYVGVGRCNLYVGWFFWIGYVVEDEFGFGRFLGGLICFLIFLINL